MSSWTASVATPGGAFAFFLSSRALRRAGATGTPPLPLWVAGVDSNGAGGSPATLARKDSRGFPIGGSTTTVGGGRGRGDEDLYRATPSCNDRVDSDRLRPDHEGGGEKRSDKEPDRVTPSIAHRVASIDRQGQRRSIIVRWRIRGGPGFNPRRVKAPHVRGQGESRKAGRQRRQGGHRRTLLHHANSRASQQGWAGRAASRRRMAENSERSGASAVSIAADSSDRSRRAWSTSGRRGPAVAPPSDRRCSFPHATGSTSIAMTGDAAPTGEPTRRRP
nr:uncharacterized protein LOC123494954 [Aegilops tauschii subsp. strangulata]